MSSPSPSSSPPSTSSVLHKSSMSVRFVEPASDSSNPSLSLCSPLVAPHCRPNGSCTAFNPSLTAPHKLVQQMKNEAPQLQPQNQVFPTTNSNLKTTTSTRHGSITEPDRSISISTPSTASISSSSAIRPPLLHLRSRSERLLTRHNLNDEINLHHNNPLPLPSHLNSETDLNQAERRDNERMFRAMYEHDSLSRLDSSDLSRSPSIASTDSISSTSSGRSSSMSSLSSEGSNGSPGGKESDSGEEEEKDEKRDREQEQDETSSEEDSEEDHEPILKQERFTDSSSSSSSSRDQPVQSSSTLPSPPSLTSTASNDPSSPSPSSLSSESTNHLIYKTDTKLHRYIESLLKEKKRIEEVEREMEKEKKREERRKKRKEKEKEGKMKSERRTERKREKKNKKSSEASKFTILDQNSSSPYSMLFPGFITPTRISLPTVLLSDLYYYSLSQSWSSLLSVACFIYFVFSLLFTFLFVGIQPQGLAIDDNSSTVETDSSSSSLSARPVLCNLVDVFFFCLGKLVTGNSDGTNLTVVRGYYFTMILYQLMGIVSIINQVLLTGIIFSRFAKPSARILFTRWAVITSHSLTGKRSLEFRCSNLRDSTILQANISVVLSRFEQDEKSGRTTRRFYNLELVQKEQPMLAAVWTVSHIIDENSPLYGYDLYSFDAVRGLITVVFGGVDCDFSDGIYANTSYMAKDLIVDGEMQSLIQHQAQRFVLDYKLFHRVMVPKKGTVEFNKGINITKMMEEKKEVENREKEREKEKEEESRGGGNEEQQDQSNTTVPLPANIVPSPVCASESSTISSTTSTSDSDSDSDSETESASDSATSPLPRPLPPCSPLHCPPPSLLHRPPLQLSRDNDDNRSV